jgi:hypothetical protein
MIWFRFKGCFSARLATDAPVSRRFISHGDAALSWRKWRALLELHTA